MKTQKQPVKFVKNDQINAKPSESKNKDSTVDLIRNSQSSHTQTQERPQIKSFKQNKLSAPPLFSEPNDPSKGCGNWMRLELPRFEKGKLNEERRRREIALSHVANEKNKKQNFSANSKLKQQSDLIADHKRLANSFAQLPKINSSYLQPTLTIYSSEGCSTPSVKQQASFKQTIFSPSGPELRGSKRVSRQLVSQRESNLPENNFCSLPQEQQIPKPDCRELMFSQLHSSNSGNFSYASHTANFFDGQSNDLQYIIPQKRTYLTGASIENQNQGHKASDEQKSQQHFTSKTLLERDVHLPRSFDEFTSCSRIPSNFFPGTSQSLRFGSSQATRQFRANTSQLSQHLMGFSRAEIRRENSISEILSEDDSQFFHAVPLTEPLDVRQFNSEISSYGKALESILGSDSLLGDQSSNHRETQRLRQDAFGTIKTAIAPKMRQQPSMNCPLTPKTNKISSQIQLLCHDHWYDQSSAVYGATFNREGQSEARKSEDSLNRLEFGKVKKRFEAPCDNKVAFQQTDDSQVLKYAKQSQLDDKQERVKKIIFHKVKIIKKDGKIIKKPYKVIIKKTGAKRKPSVPKMPDSYLYKQQDSLIQLQKLRRRGAKPEFLNQRQQDVQECELSNRERVQVVQNSQGREKYSAFQKSGPISGDTQSAMAQNRPNHIHHHHYYILNQAPLFQTFNIREYDIERYKQPQTSNFSSQSRQNFAQQPDQISKRSNQQEKQKENSMYKTMRRSKDRGQKEQASLSPRKRASTSSLHENLAKNLLPSVESSIAGDFNSLGAEQPGSYDSSLQNLINQNSKAGPADRSCRQSTNQHRLLRLNSVFPQSSPQRKIQMQSLHKDRSPLLRKRDIKSVSLQKQAQQPLSTQNIDKRHKRQQPAEFPELIDDQDNVSVHSLFGDTLKGPQVVRMRPHNAKDVYFESKSAQRSLERQTPRPASPIQFETPINAPQVILFELTKVKNHHNCFLMNPFQRFSSLRHDFLDWAPISEGEKKLDNEAWHSQILNVNRYLKVRRFLEKRQRRIWNTRISYAVRKEVACKRPRVAGKFIKKQSYDLAQTDEPQVLNLVTIQQLQTQQQHQQTRERTPSKLTQIRKASKDNISKEEAVSTPAKGPKEKRQAKNQTKEPKTANKLQKTTRKKVDRKAEKSDERS